MGTCIVCGCLRGIAEVNRQPTVEDVLLEGFVLGVVAQRAVHSIGTNVSGNLCPGHLDYVKRSATIAAEKIPSIAPFCNFGLTVVK